MVIRRIGIIAYIVFLGFYAWYKYSVAAPPDFSAVYTQSVAILVLMTGVAPFAFALLAVKTMRIRGLLGITFAFFIGLAACVIGYGAFWWFFIVPGGDAPALYDVAVRGVGWGLLQGAIAYLIANH